MAEVDGGVGRARAQGAGVRDAVAARGDGAPDAIGDAGAAVTDAGAPDSPVTGRLAAAEDADSATRPAPGADPRPGRAPNAPGDARQRPWARVLATISLVVGIVGVGLSWVPFVGRLVAGACAALGLVCGVVAVRATPAGAKGSRHAVAVVGVTLACVCLFEALRLTGCSAITGTVTGAAQNLVAGAVS